MKPRFSIIIETTNVHEENSVGIQHALPQIVSQTKGENAEIILVDGTEGGAVKKLLKKYPAIKHIPKPGASYAECKNTGLKSSKGDIIVLLDSDCVIQQDWFKNMKDTMEKGVHIVTGFTHYPLTNLHSKVLSVFDFLPEGKYQLTDRFSANNLAVKREIYEKQQFPEGLPDITAASVGILGWKWNQSHEILFNPKMEVKHNYYPNVFTNRLNAGFGGIVMRKAEPRFPLARLLTYTGILFPFIFYLPRVIKDIRRMTSARKLLKIKWYEYHSACLLIAYYRFVEMIGMAVGIAYPLYFTRPGQIRAF